MYSVHDRDSSCGLFDQFSCAGAKGKATFKGGISRHAHTLLLLMPPSSPAMSKFPRVPSTVTPSPSHNIAPLQSPFPADAAFFSCHEPTFQGWRQHCPYPFLLMSPSSLAMSQPSKGGINIAHTLSHLHPGLPWSLPNRSHCHHLWPFAAPPQDLPTTKGGVSCINHAHTLPCSCRHIHWP